MQHFTRDNLIAKARQAKERVKDVPLFDGTVRIRSVSELERGRIESRPILAESDDERRGAVRETAVRWIIAACIDVEGNPLFTADDIPELLSWDSAITRTLYAEIMIHCGVRNTVEESEKNSGGTGGGCSPGPSPSIAASPA